MQCVAVCCSVLQCVAGWCKLLQCGAVCGVTRVGRLCVYVHVCVCLSVLVCD